jgi:hypothetical protein
MPMVPVMPRWLRRMSWGERLQYVGMTLFFGSVILGLPVFGIGWNAPHPEYPETEPQLVRVPLWLGAIGISGMGLVFLGLIVRSVRER